MSFILGWTLIPFGIFLWCFGKFAIIGAPLQDPEKVEGVVMSGKAIAAVGSWLVWLALLCFIVSAVSENRSQINDLKDGQASVLETSQERDK